MTHHSAHHEALLTGKESKTARLFQDLAPAVLAWFMLSDLGLIDLVPVLRSYPMAIIGVTMACAAAGGARARTLLQGGVIALMGLWLIVAWTPLSTWLIQPLRVAQAPEAADAVVVLAGGFQPDNDFSTPTFERTVHGLELMQDRLAPRLIVSEDVPPAGAAKALKAKLNVPGSLISIGPARDTHDEAVLLGQLARKNGWNKILLVTSPAHSRRAALTFQKVGITVISSPCRETAFDFENSNDPHGQLTAFASAMHEIVSLRFYRARGWA